MIDAQGSRARATVERIVGSGRRVLLSAVGLVLAVAGCECGGDPPETTSCDTSDACPVGQICVAGECRPRADGGDPACEDDDGDGFGPMCRLGADCDDTDPTQTGREVCGDGADNDCDGEVDENIGVCGDCNPYCRSESVGRGGVSGFDLDADDSSGVVLDPDGALVLDSQEIDTGFIWIANTGEGTVSKVDTDTFVEVGRYITGPNARSNDPSRTSVNSLGDVYIGNRASGTVTKISALGENCPDANGDGVITTSTGPTDVLAWGMDDCVLWNTVVADSDKIRAVAAQDVEGLDFSIESFVWVGDHTDRRVLKLDGDTGAILIDATVTSRPYGFALDGSGTLWISSRNQGNAMGRLDTAACTPAACMDEVVPIPGGRNPYGITVDLKQRVWTANHGSSTISRFDPATDTWVEVNVGINCHGIAADAEGWIWAAGQGAGVVRLFGDDPTMWTVVPGTTGFSNKGMAVDADGKIWSVTRNTNAVVITPGPTLMDATVDTTSATGFVSPYTYSDMTGQQLRLATNPRGYYRRVFEACPETTARSATWLELMYEAEAPPGTQVVFRVRTAPDAISLMDADWVVVAELPPPSTTAELQSALDGAGVTHGRFLEVEAILISERDSGMSIVTPKVYSFGPTYECPPVVL